MKRPTNDLDLVALLDTVRTASFERAVRSVAHQLGTPVNVVLGHAELLEDGASEQSVRAIVAQAHAMTQSLQGAVSYAEAEARPGTPGALFDEVAPVVQELVQPGADAGAIELTLSAQGDSGLSKEEALVVLLALARFGIAHAGRGDRVALSAAGGATARVTLECPSSRLSASSVRQLAEPWFADGRTAGGLELSTALWIVRRARGTTRLERVESGIVLDSSWPNADG